MTPLHHAPPAANGASNKKLICGIIGLAVGLCLIVALFVGGIIGIVFYSIGHSQAAETAKTFLRRNERLKQDIGEIKDFGMFVSGNINTQNGDGNAILTIKVLGARQTVQATVQLAYRNGRQWLVTNAHYNDDTGRRVTLLNPYDSAPDSEPTIEQGTAPPAAENLQLPSAKKQLRGKSSNTQ